MSISVGDLVKLDDNHGIVIKEVSSSVFEGGEKCKIVSVLFFGSDSVKEVMSWNLERLVK